MNFECCCNSHWKKTILSKHTDYLYLYIECESEAYNSKFILVLR